MPRMVGPCPRRHVGHRRTEAAFGSGSTVTRRIHAPQTESLAQAAIYQSRKAFPRPRRPRRFRSSYSDNDGQCVEVAANLVASHGVVPVRDSNNQAAPTLILPAGAFSSFVASMRAGACTESAPLA